LNVIEGGKHQVKLAKIPIIKIPRAIVVSKRVRPGDEEKIFFIKKFIEY